MEVDVYHCQGIKSRRRLNFNCNVIHVELDVRHEPNWKVSTKIIFFVTSGHHSISRGLVSGPLLLVEVLPSHVELVRYFEILVLQFVCIRLIRRYETIHQDMLIFTYHSFHPAQPDWCRTVSVERFTLHRVIEEVLAK